MVEAKRTRGLASKAWRHWRLRSILKAWSRWQEFLGQARQQCETEERVRQVFRRIEREWERTSRASVFDDWADAAAQSKRDKNEHEALQRESLGAALKLDMDGLTESLQRQRHLVTCAWVAWQQHHSRIAAVTRLAHRIFMFWRRTLLADCVSCWEMRVWDRIRAEGEAKERAHQEELVQRKAAEAKLQEELAMKNVKIKGLAAERQSLHASSERLCERLQARQDTSAVQFQGRVVRRAERATKLRVWGHWQGEIARGRVVCRVLLRRQRRRMWVALHGWMRRWLETARVKAIGVMATRLTHSKVYRRIVAFWYAEAVYQVARQRSIALLTSGALRRQTCAASALAVNWWRQTCAGNRALARETNRVQAHVRRRRLRRAFLPWARSSADTQTRRTMLLRCVAARCTHAQVRQCVREWHARVAAKMQGRARARTAARHVTEARMRRVMRAWAAEVQHEKAARKTCDMIARRARRSALLGAWGRWEIFMSLAEAMAAVEQNWRRIFAKIERAWDRTYLHRVVQGWKKEVDVVWEDKREAQERRATEELEQTREQLHHAQALAACNADAERRMSALETLILAHGSGMEGTVRGGGGGGDTGRGKGADDHNSENGGIGVGSPLSTPSTPSTPSATPRCWLSTEKLVAANGDLAGGPVEAYLARLEGVSLSLCLSVSLSLCRSVALSACLVSMLVFFCVSVTR